MLSATFAPSVIQPQVHVAVRLPSGAHKIVKIVPDTTISLGKYGSLPANLLLDRPYYLTFEILDKADERPPIQLRVVSAAELNTEAICEDSSPSESRDEVGEELEDVNYEDSANDGAILSRNNQLTVDDPARQGLSMEEIEELKRVEAGSGKSIIAKIMQAHTALEEKTAFSLAKYTLRKSRKYLKRFTVIPLNVSVLAQWMLYEKEPGRVMEIREEALGLVTSWLNVYRTIDSKDMHSGDTRQTGQGRWLVVDDTSGMMIAAMAEKMGILYPYFAEEDLGEVLADEENLPQSGNAEGEKVGERPPRLMALTRNAAHGKHRRHAPDAMSATANTITLIHPASQPNLMVLSYFSYDPLEITEASPVATSLHPLHTHLKTLSWLQLLSPQLDTAYMEPEVVAEDILATWKPGKRGTYYRKRRRWERVKRVVDETRAGGFDGLLVASATNPESILHHLVPLLRSGAQVVVYSATAEPLADLVDAYSSARKAAFLQVLNAVEGDEEEPALRLPNEDFPLDPRLLLSTNLQTVRATEWQVLPGRTHPLMTTRGGAEGYVFTGTKVIPIEGRVSARGTLNKKRKVNPEEQDRAGRS